MRMLMHVVCTSVKPRLTEGGSGVVEHGIGDQLPEGTAARLAAGDGIGDLSANEAVKDDFSQTLVVVVGASAIAVVVVGGAIAAAIAASACAVIADAAGIIVDAASSVADGSSVSASVGRPAVEERAKERVGAARRAGVREGDLDRPVVGNGPTAEVVAVAVRTAIRSAVVVKEIAVAIHVASAVDASASTSSGGGRARGVGGRCNMSSGSGGESGSVRARGGRQAATRTASRASSAPTPTPTPAPTPACARRFCSAGRKVTEESRCLKRRIVRFGVCPVSGNVLGKPSPRREGDGRAHEGAKARHAPTGLVPQAERHVPTCARAELGEEAVAARRDGAGRADDDDDKAQVHAMDRR